MTTTILLLALVSMAIVCYLATVKCKFCHAAYGVLAAICSRNLCLTCRKCGKATIIFDVEL